ncbi:MAG: hypothetical protein AAGA10_13050 [Bacteroidota bacterium]
MILDSLKEGKPVPIGLPTHEAGGYGDGTLCQIGISQTLYCGAKYVPFAPKGINWIAQGNSDVISYNFSGCIMAVFTHEGTRKVCHISTGNNQNCLDEWQKIKKASSQVFEFKPSDFISYKNTQFLGCYGLITRDLRTYAITVGMSGGQRIVAGVKKARLLRPY